mmetsp:Transcript_17633/g.52977  ORF Transcript_17633/g.52977 Transcript_17633/m.52977 type:complete len:263 (+) Transcript_17633:2674-3462(+)
MSAIAPRFCTSSAASNSTDTSDSVPWAGRHGKAWLMMRRRAAGSQCPPSSPMTSTPLRCAWKSITTDACDWTSSTKGWAWGPPLPGGPTNSRMRSRSRLSDVAPTAAAPPASRRGRAIAYSVRATDTQSCSATSGLGTFRGALLRGLGGARAGRGAFSGSGGGSTNLPASSYFAGSSPARLAAPSALSWATTGGLRPYARAEAQYGSSSLPDRVNPGPLSSILGGGSLPEMQSLMSHFWQCDVTDFAGLVPMCLAHAFQSRP